VGDTRSCPSCNLTIPVDAAFCAACGAPATSQRLTETLIGVSRPSTGTTSYELAPERLQAAIGANYELGRLIGRGGFAEVFAVRDVRLKRELALKVLRPDLILSDTLVERFRREAEAVAAIQSTHIVPVYDVGEADGICWLLMPLVLGETLKSLLIRQGRLPVEDARRILLEAAEGLQAAHAAGVVHRDIKPENLILEAMTGRVLLMDFGIAKAMDASVEHSLTGTGVVIGTPRYMSPEQAMGKQVPDPRSDQYSLAAVGYQMLTGRVPFEGDNVREVMARQLLEEPTPISRIVTGIPGAVSGTIHQALRKDPKLRFASMAAFAKSLRGELLSFEEGGAVRRKAEFNIPTRRRPWRAVAGWVLLAGAVGFGAKQAGWLTPMASTPAPAESVKATPDTPTARPPGGSRPGRPAPVLTGEDTATALLPPPSPLTDCAEAFAAGVWTTAVPLCRSEAESNAASRRNLGLLYANGYGVEQNDRTAALHLGFAAQDFDTIAVLEMAARYDSGKGVSVDQGKATGLYDLAANLGVNQAYPLLARRLEQGVGIRADPKKAAFWYEKAAGNGDLYSTIRLAAAYAEGRGVKKDEQRAQALYSKAAERRDPEGEYRMGMMLLHGKGGMAKDERAAEGWLKRAAQQGHTEAIKEVVRRKW
jgi:serine/threonine-protein kinase